MELLKRMLGYEEQEMTIGDMDGALLVRDAREQIAQLKGDNAKLRGLLRRVEWKGQNGTCPSCGWTTLTGHLSLCGLRKAIE